MTRLAFHTKMRMKLKNRNSVGFWRMKSGSEDMVREEDEAGRGCKHESRCGSVLVAFMFIGMGVLISCVAAGRAHCSIVWKISIPCFDVCSLLVNQIKEWEVESCPPNSLKCLYSLVAIIGDNIVATHATPVMRLVSDMAFNFSSTNPDSCEIQGRSTSRSWYAMFDSGTNCVNLYNLMKGSGLSSAPSFTEVTSDCLCARYSSTRLRLDAGN